MFRNLYAFILIQVAFVLFEFECFMDKKEEFSLAKHFLALTKSLNKGSIRKLIWFYVIMTHKNKYENTKKNKLISNEKKTFTRFKRDFFQRPDKVRPKSYE
jgi:hypothetical protein